MQIIVEKQSKYNKSHAAFSGACGYIAGGVNSPVRAFGGVDEDPLFIESAYGSKIRDIDGNEYIDFVGAWGPMILGHAHPEVLKAVMAAAQKGKMVLCVEDGPTLTHGGMPYGAAVMAARKFQAAGIVDPRPYATGKIERTFRRYPGIGMLLPAMGYGEEQVRDLEKTIAKVECDTVVIGTPIDLGRIISIPQPSLRVMYDLQEIGRPNLEDALEGILKA